MKTSLRLVVAALLAGAAAAHAGDIYRWVDDDGRTHISDKVPDQYRERARRYDGDAFKPNPADQKASRERLERIKKEAEAQERARAPAAAASGPVIIGSGKSAQGATGIQSSPRAPSTSASTENCQADWDAYNASQACFAPFRNKNGSMRGEAFEKCGQPLLQPLCGRNYTQ